MKTMKRAVSLFLTVSLLFGLLALICGAADKQSGESSDILRCTGWYLCPEDQTQRVFEVILHPRFVEQAEQVRISTASSDFTTGRDYETYRIERRRIDEIGECFVLYLITNFDAAYLYPNAFFDRDGNGNAEVFITGSATFTGQPILKTDAEWVHKADGNVYDAAQGSSAEITFAVNGTVTYDGRVLAENVRAYTLLLAQTGEYTLEIAVNPLIRRTYTLHVKTAEQLRSERIADLKTKLSDLNEIFWRSIPMALLSIAYTPLVMFWPFTVFLQLSPIAALKEIFVTLSELRKLRFG